MADQDGQGVSAAQSMAKTKNADAEMKVSLDVSSALYLPAFTLFVLSLTFLTKLLRSIGSSTLVPFTSVLANL